MATNACTSKQTERQAGLNAALVPQPFTRDGYDYTHAISFPLNNLPHFYRLVQQDVLVLNL